MLKTVYVRSIMICLTAVYGALSIAQESLILTRRQECDLELLLNGGFAPLKGFLSRADYEGVVHNMRLTDGALWPMPIMLDVPQGVAQKLQVGDTVLLKDSCFITLATMKIEDIWKPNKQEEAQHVFGTTSADHPGVDYLYNRMHDFYIGGTVTLVQMPRHYDFNELRRTPDQMKQCFKDKGISKIVAFQTRNPMHRAHHAITLRAAQEEGAHLLIHPVVGMTKPGDIDYVTRMRCYKKIITHYPEGIATLSVLPLAMRMAGPREAVWHALIRKNYGATHFIVGRDHAGPGKDSNGKDFYGFYDAQQLVARYADEIGITLVPFQEMVYVQEDDCYKPMDQISPHDTVLNISGTQLRKLLRDGLPIPTYFSYPEIIIELQKQSPSQTKKGLTIFFTGLSGAGKTTLACALSERLGELQERNITLLDGDVIRNHLSQELGFSKEHRSINVRRVGYVASEITKNGGLAICSLIAPYQADRAYNRHLISKRGDYIEVYVATSLEVCEERDVKQLYAKAREGIIPRFTGISDPYEVPENPEIVIDTEGISIEQGINVITHYLYEKGYLS